MMFMIGFALCFSYLVRGNPLALEKYGNAVEKVPISRYPYQAAVVYNVSSWVLPGAIIHERYIITSVFYNLIWESTLVNVVVGESEISGSEHLHDVEEVIINSNFSFGTDYNVALLKLKEPIKFSKHAKKISISSSPPEDSTAFITKWIHSNDNNGLDTYDLGKSMVNTLSKELCQPFYISSVVSDTSFCGYNNAAMLISKDSGAPLVQNGKLVGLYQGTPAVPYYCKDSTYCPSVFTDLSTVNSWIDEVINK